MVYRIILYLLTAICLYSFYLQLEFYLYFFNYPGNPVRDENLLAIFLVGIYSSLVWISTILIANIKKTYFTSAERIIAILSGILVGLSTAVSIVLDFAI